MLAMAPSVQKIHLKDDNWKVIILAQIMCIMIMYMQNELFKKSEIKLVHISCPFSYIHSRN